jgi:hypothetical protein
MACFVLPASPAGSEEIVRRIEWQQLAAANNLRSGTVVTRPEGADGPTLRLVHERNVPVTFPLVTIERPAIRTSRYAIRGRVKYEGLTAGGYLEMWNHLPEGAFFSRTLDQIGPMQRLVGSSGWRPFVLPFFNRDGGSPPQRLVLNLVLAGAGTVELGPLELVQFGATENPLGGSEPRWDDPGPE